jgi:galactokinase
MGDEQLRCNICEVVVSSSQTKDHASTSSHESRRSELEQELKDIRKENYKDDSSVIVVWENSI